MQKEEELVIKLYTKVGKLGRVLIPHEVRERIGLKEGEELELRLLKLGDAWMIILQKGSKTEGDRNA